MHGRRRCTSKRTIKVLSALIVLWLIGRFIVSFSNSDSRPLANIAGNVLDSKEDVDAVRVTRKSSSRRQHSSKNGIKFIDVAETSIAVNSSMSEVDAETNFHEYVSQLQVSCNDHIRIGNVSDGGWDVCVGAPYQLNDPCLVYSFGIGDNWSFDDGMASKFGCTVRSFDPSINQQDHIRNERIHFYNVGIGNKDMSDGVTGWKLKTLSSLIAMCHDEQETIDYLKLDVESHEWSALETMFKDNVLGRVKQLAIEIHTKELNEIKSSVKDFHRYWTILHHLESLGFRKWYWHFNTWGFFPNKDSSKYISCCYELVYLNTNYLP